MVLADDTLFLAGPADLIDEEDAAARFGEPDVQAALAEQDAVLQGAQGATLWAVSKNDGSKLAEFQLDSLPIFDGLAAAGGRLYLATTDGKILCLGGR